MSRPHAPITWLLFISLMLYAAPSFSTDAQKNASKDAVWVNQVFQKGKAFYEAGNYTSALREWKQLDPYLDQYPSFQKVIGYLKSQVKPDAEPQKARPADPSIRAAMQKGRVAFENGDWKTALEEWKRVEQYLDPSSQEYAQLQKLKRDYETAQIAQKQGEAAGQSATVSQVPSEFSNYLNDASDRLKKQIVEVQSRQDNLEKESVFEQAWIETTFNRGKDAFEAGNYALAMEEWNKIAFKMKDDAAFASSMEQLKQASRAYREAELRYSESAGNVQETAQPANKQMQNFLSQAAADLKSKADEVAQQGMEKQQSTADLQKQVDETFEKGREFYQKGRFKEAIDEWLLLQPRFEGDPVTKAAFLSAEGSLRSYEMATSTFQGSVDSGAYKLRLPDGFFRYVENATHELAEKAGQTDAERQKTEAAVTAKRAELITAFEKGKGYYGVGRIAEAATEWKKIVPWVENGEELGNQLTKLEASAQETARLSGALKEARAKSVGAYTAPAELAQLLQVAGQELKNQSETATNERLLINQTLSQKQAAASNFIYKGNLAYKSGKTEQAIAEWEKLVPYLETTSQEKALIEELRRNYDDYQKAYAANREALMKKNEPVGIPADLKKSLMDTNEDLLRRSTETLAQLQVNQSGADERRATVASALEKGRLFYQAGHLEDALAEWQKLTPYMDPASPDKILLEDLNQNQRDSKEAAKQLAAASKNSDVSVGLPEDLRKSLAQTNQQLLQKADQAWKESEKLEARFTDQRAVVASAIEKGRFFHQSGRFDQALAEWQKLLPYLDPASKEYALIEQFKQSYDDFLQADVSQKQSFAKKDVKADIPQDIQQLLIQTNQDLLKKTDALHVQRDNRESDRKSAEAAVASALEKGKLYYQTSRLDQAISEWEKLIPYLDSASEEKMLIENLRQSYTEFSKASAQLKETVSRSDVKIEVPADLSKTLSTTTQDLITKANDLRTQRQGLETKFNDRQTWALSTLEKATVYSKAGRAAEALEEWKKLADILDDNSGATKAAIRDLEATLTQYHAEQQALNEILPKKDAKLPMPSEMPSLISELKTKIAEDTQAAQLSKAQMEKEVTERQLFIDKTYAAGKALLAEGKEIEAVYEWEKLVPYLDDKSGLPALLQGIKKQWQAFQDSKKSNEIFISTRYKENNVSFSAELQKLLSNLDLSVQKSLGESQAKRAEMEKGLAERQAWIGSTFEKGKAYYEVGKYKEALEFWGNLASTLKEDPALQALLTSLPQKYEVMLQAQKTAENSEAQKNAPLAPPAGMTEALTQAAEKLSSVATDAMSRSEKARAENDSRNIAMNELFSQGMAFAEKGQWEAAIKAWSGLPPYLADGDKVKVAVDNLAASYQNYVKTLSEAQKAEAALNTRLAGPKDLSAVLIDAAFKLDKERQATDLARERTDKILAEKQTAVDKLYSDGKAFYDQGKLADAFAAWRSMLPSVDNEKSLEEQLAKADQSYQLYISSKEQNQQSMSRKELKLAAPVELSQMLETVNKQLRDQVFDLKSRSSQTEKMLGERKDWIDVTFQKGKLAYSQGRYQEAAAEWKTMLPFIENGSALEAGISDFERNLQVSLEASKTNAEADAKKNMKFPAPDELGVLLVQLNEKVKNEALEAGAEKIRADQQSSERQKWLKQTFELGRSFYLEGKYDQAISEWEKLAPFLEAQAGTLQLLDAVKQGYQDSLEAKKGAVEAAAGDYQGLKMPYADQMTRLLNEANAKLKEEAEAARTKTGEMQKTLAERQEWSTTTFNKGKVFFDEERYEEALGQWERLLPYLAEGSDIKRQITSLRESLNTIMAGKDVSGGSSSGEPPVKLRNEDEILGVLETANQKFKEEAEASRAKEREAQLSFEQRKNWIEATFQKGKTYYDQNNYSKAVEEWGVLGPYLGEHPKIREMIEEAKKNYTEGRYTQQIIESMEAKKAALTPLPAGAETAVPSAPQEESRPQQAQAGSAEEQAPSAPSTEESQSAPSAGEQLISGEIVSIDEPARTITMKLFTESGSNETVTVNFDEHTQVDGSEIKTLSGAQNGGSIDVRYNPQTSHAQYIYVY